MSIITSTTDITNNRVRHSGTKFSAYLHGRPRSVYVQRYVRRGCAGALPGTPFRQRDRSSSYGKLPR